MYFYHDVDHSVLLDMLAMHTNRVTQIMIYGESYLREYETCRRNIELIQNEVLSRRGFYLNGLSYDKEFNQPSAA